MEVPEEVVVDRQDDDVGSTVVDHGHTAGGDEVTHQDGMEAGNEEVVEVDHRVEREDDQVGGASTTATGQSESSASSSSESEGTAPYATPVTATTTATAAAVKKQGNEMPHSLRLDSDSSLRYKFHPKKTGDKNSAENDIATGVEKPLTTKPNRKKKLVDPIEEVQQQQQQQQINNQRRRSTSMYSRRGPPPRRYDLSDLENMSEDQIIQVLRDDPELHAAAIKAAQEERKASRQSNRNRGGGGGSSNSNRKRDRGGRSSTTGKRQPPSTAVEDVNITFLVIQWILVLAFMGFIGFHLRKILIQPDPSKGASGNTKNVGTSDGKNSKKQKQGKKHGKLNGHAAKRSTIPEKSPKDDNDDAAMTPSSSKNETNEDISSLVSSEPSQAIRSVKSKKTSTKKKKQSPKSDVGSKERALENNKNQPAAPNTDSTVVAADVDEVAPSLEDTGKSSDSNDGEDDSEAWQKVSKSKLSNAVIQSGTNSNKKLETKMAASTLARELNAVTTASAIDEPANAQGANEEESKPQSTATASKVEKPKDGKKKKKSKSSSSNDITVNAREQVAVASTDKDAELARMLQLEEENLAKAENVTENNATHEEEVWEAVTQKKKKTTTAIIA